MICAIESEKEEHFGRKAVQMGHITSLAFMQMKCRRSFGFTYHLINAGKGMVPSTQCTCSPDALYYINLLYRQRISLSFCRRFELFGFKQDSDVA